MFDRRSRAGKTSKRAPIASPALVRGDQWGAPVRWLYLGGDTVIDSDEVVAVLDGDMTRRSAALAESVRLSAAAGKAIDVSEGGSIKSVVITADRVYLSQVAPPTLGRRANIVYLGEGEGEE